MKKVYLYAGYKICAGILIAMLAIFALTLLLESVKYFYAGDTAGFLHDLLRRMPLFLLGSAPVGCIVGGAVSLHLLSKNEELTVMRCLGVSGWRLICLVSAPGLFLGVLMFLWLEAVAIPTHRFYETGAANANKIVVKNDVWFNAGDTFFFFDTLEILPSRERAIARNVNRITLRENTISEYAHLEKTEYTKQGSVTPGFALPLTVLELVALLGDNTRAQSTADLWRLTQIDNTGNLRVELKLWDFWRRVSWPLLFATFILLMTAMALRYAPRGDLFRNIVFAIVIGLLADMLFTLASFGGMILNLPVAIASLLPILICAAVSMHVIRQKT